MNEEANLRLVKAFPTESDNLVFRAVKAGVLLADDLLENVGFLKNAIGRDIRGHLRRAGIIYQIHEFSVRGDLPFKTQITHMPIGSWHLLEIKSDGLLAHVCRTDEPFAFPVDSPNRQDARFINQGDLFRETPNVIAISSEVKSSRQLYSWLMHGQDIKGNITHLAWGIPYAETEEWMGYRDILKSIAREETIPAPAPDAPDPKSRLRFLEHIEASLEKTDNVQSS